MNFSFYLRPLFVLFLSLVLLFSGLGAFPLTDRDEGEYATSASEMIKNGDYVVPTLNGRPYLEKPILFFWVLSASFKVFGQNELAARLPSALSGLLIILTLYGLYFFLPERDFSGKKHLFAITSLVLLSCPLFLLVARACLTDMLLSLFIWLSMALFFLSMEKGSSIWLLGLSWLFLSLGFLTKGPVAMAMSLPVFGLYSFLRRDFLWLRPVRVFTGVAIFLVINLPWYLAIYGRMGNSFIETFFLTQNLERFARTLLGHGGGPFFYLAVLAAGLFPFSAMIPRVIRKDFGLLKKAFYNSGLEVTERLRLFSFLATVWIFLLLTTAATKQINYIVPVLPFLSISMGCLLMEEKWQCLISKWLFLPVLALFIISCLFLIFGLGQVWNHLQGLIRFDSSEYAFPVTPPVQLALWGLGLLLVTALCGYAFLRRGSEDLITRFSAGVLFAAFFVILFLPAICRMVQLPSKEMALEVRKVINKGVAKDAGATLASFGLWKPSMIFYTGHPIKRIKTKHPDRLAKALSRRRPCLVFSRVRLEEELKEIKGFWPIGERAGYLLGGNREGYLLMKTKEY